MLIINFTFTEFMLYIFAHFRSFYLYFWIDGIDGYPRNHGHRPYIFSWPTISRYDFLFFSEEKTVSFWFVSSASKPLPDIHKLNYKTDFMYLLFVTSGLYFPFLWHTLTRLLWTLMRTKAEEGETTQKTNIQREGRRGAI